MTTVIHQDRDTAQFNGWQDRPMRERERSNRRLLAEIRASHHTSRHAGQRRGFAAYSTKRNSGDG
ncbi:MAG: hypothetical protein ACREVE_15445 [Gammaproteobacteria bacterium]